MGCNSSKSAEVSPSIQPATASAKKSTPLPKNTDDTNHLAVPSQSKMSTTKLATNRPHSPSQVDRVQASISKAKMSDEKTSSHTLAPIKSTEVSSVPTVLAEKRVQSANKKAVLPPITTVASVETDKLTEIKLIEPLSSAKKYKLTYFDIRGRGEVIRLIFNASGVQFEDCRIPFSDWASLKSKTPLGSVPLLEINGSPILVQSTAIARFVAKETGLAGKTDLEQVKADSVVDTAFELVVSYFEKIVPLSSSENKDAAKIIGAFIQTDLAPNFAKLIKLLEMYGSKGYFIGSKLTWADIYVHELITNIQLLDKNILEGYPALSENRKKVEENSKLAAYLKSRKM